MRIFHANLIFLTETYLLHCNKNYLHNLLGFHYIVFVPPITNWKGVLLLLWKDDISLRIEQYTTHLIHAKINLSDSEWDMACIYGQPRRQLRKKFWEHYTSLLADITKTFLFSEISII